MVNPVPVENAVTGFLYSKILARCTFEPNNGEVVGITIDDAYIVIDRQPYRTIYTVNCQFAFRGETGPPRGYIDGPTARREAEYHLAKLLDDLGGIQEPSTIRLSGREFYIPPAKAVAGTLYNPFTGLAYANVYLTRAATDDSGGRVYGYTLTFEGYDFPYPSLSDGADPSSFNPTLVFTPPIGPTMPTELVTLANGPYEITSSVDQFFITYSVRGILYGEDPVESVLADSLGFSNFVRLQIPRGVAGFRGLIKSYHITTAGSLNSEDLPAPLVEGSYDPVAYDAEPVGASTSVLLLSGHPQLESLPMVSLEELWLESLSTTTLSTAIREINLTFVKAR